MTDSMEARRETVDPGTMESGGFPDMPPDQGAGEVDPIHYYGVDELASMPDQTLEALVDHIPSERLRWYESVLNNQLEERYGHGEVDEVAVLEVIHRLIDAYYQDYRVPIQVVGKWVVVPENLRRHVEQGEGLKEGLAEASPARPSPKVMVAAAVAGLLLVVLSFSLIRRAASASRVTEADQTATAEQAPTQTPESDTATSTPLALEAADRIIEHGEDLRDYYPVLLEVAPSASDGGRVFVVQQKAVGTADWDYSREPDTASWVSGLVVRPVLGIPYTPDNAEFLAGLAPDDTVLLRMSTGAVLTFELESARRVGRQDTSIFRQVSPGIVLVLLADPEGDRLVLFGSYASEQELARPDVLQAIDASPVADAGTTLEDSVTGQRLRVIETRSLSDSSLPEDLMYLVIDAAFLAADEPLEVASLRLELVDSLGNRYTPAAASSPAANYPPMSGQHLTTGSELRASLTYIVPRDLTGPLVWRAQAGSEAPTLAFALDYEPPSTEAVDDLEVMLLAVEAPAEEEGEDRRLAARVRVFNGQEGVIDLRAEDVFTIPSPVDPEDQFPVGPHVYPPGWQTAVIQPGEAVDLELTFEWDGSPYVGLYVAGRRYLLTQVEAR